ncbi:hypothetical protein KFL_003620050 [Klebsormidium nitens]|uniref:Uncharacterized protein n=1 Tax=Klebsormidium nitens TaxID=105231 RepID=A0A1Y1I9D0_KLENI|nr:hypothetical protein KFL_003620050 [Klebsormidium nitens]|eukprot:GAQ87574.1 hypothetical protein KFL_003620050 [Klebsormidium nitens]
MVLEARAKLHAEAGVGFYKRFSRFKDHEDDYKAGLRRKVTFAPPPLIRFRRIQSVSSFRWDFMQLSVGGRIMVAGCHDVLVQPRVTSQARHVGPDWSFSGGNRLVVKLDPKAVGACKAENNGTDPPYDVSFIKDSWKPKTPPKELDNERVIMCEGLQYWQETGFAKVQESEGENPYPYKHPARRYAYRSLHLNQAASAPYAMYRMLCLFPWLISEWRPCDYYKCLWYFTVEHKETGFVFQMSEHKASLHAVIEWDPESPWADCFKSEACALLELILSDASRHPCGVLAGSIDPVVFKPYKEHWTKLKLFLLSRAAPHSFISFTFYRSGFGPSNCLMKRCVSSLVCTGRNTGLPGLPARPSPSLLVLPGDLTPCPVYRLPCPVTTPGSQSTDVLPGLAKSLGRKNDRATILYYRAAHHKAATRPGAADIAGQVRRAASTAGQRSRGRKPGSEIRPGN